MSIPYISAPWEVVIDTREQTPWQFKSLQGLDKQKKGPPSPLVIKSQSKALKTGDYSIVGYEDQFTLERKSLEDALGTFTSGRERFERELERMASMKFAAVVLEFPAWPRIPKERKVKWHTMEGSIRAWRQRFGVHFIHCSNRLFAELTAIQEMWRWWCDHELPEGKSLPWRPFNPIELGQESREEQYLGEAMSEGHDCDYVSECLAVSNQITNAAGSSEVDGILLNVADGDLAVIEAALRIAAEVHARSAFGGEFAKVLLTVREAMQ